MFRLKFLSSPNGRRRSANKPGVRASVSFYGRQDGTVVDNPPVTSTLGFRRTVSTEAMMGMPEIGCNDQPFGSGHLRRQQARDEVMSHEVNITHPVGYSKPVETIREEEYPHMNKGIYFDHSGATIYAKSTIEGFTTKMLTGLYGNPHSANEPAKISGDAVDSVREQALRFFGADPKDFDLVFVANATAGIKLVAEAFRDMAENTRTGTFWYGYHKEAHTSLVGPREYTNGDHHCFVEDEDVAAWLENPAGSRFVNRRNPTGLGLLAYPGQSNLNGRRLPPKWVKQLRESQALSNTYSFLDAAALAMTSPLDHLFADPSSAPDFTCVSFYKIFGFPDLGGLIVRKDSGHILALRKYFGGGTVSMVSTIGDSWHKSKALDTGYAIHDGLEDGTLPFHSILALGEAIEVHKKLYGSMYNISRHTTNLIRVLYNSMSALQHPNGQQVCHIYSEDHGFGDPTKQGATIAFNIFRQDGTYVPYSTVESMANEEGIYIRSGGICCPGGLFSALGYEPWELDRARSAGHHCGSQGISVIHQLPTGVVRASVGAMSTAREVRAFLAFLREVFVEKDFCAGRVASSGRDSAVAMHAVPPASTPPPPPPTSAPPPPPTLSVPPPPPLSYVPMVYPLVSDAVC